MPKEPLFLGVDPGIATTGYGLVRPVGNKLVLLDFGVILTSPKQPLPERLMALHIGLRDIIAKYSPDAMAVEELFFNVNVKTALVVGQARGVILLTGGQAGLSVTSYTPSAVKLAVCGSGSADKRQVQDMVKRLTGLVEIPKPDDAADAIAIAICHSHSYKLKSLL